MTATEAIEILRNEAEQFRSGGIPALANRFDGIADVIERLQADLNSSKSRGLELQAENEELRGALERFALEEKNDPVSLGGDSYFVCKICGSDCGHSPDCVLNRDALLRKDDDE